MVDSGGVTGGGTGGTKSTGGIPALGGFVGTGGTGAARTVWGLHIRGWRDTPCRRPGDGAQVQHSDHDFTNPAPPVYVMVTDAAKAQDAYHATLALPGFHREPTPCP